MFSSQNIEEKCVISYESSLHTYIMIIDNLDSSIYFSVSLILLHYITYYTTCPRKSNSFQNELINPDTCFIRNSFSWRVVNDENEVFTTSSTITVSNFVYIDVSFPTLPDHNVYNPD